MRITKYSIVAIVSVLLVTGFVAYSIYTTFLTPEDPEKRLLEEHEKVTEKGIPDFGPEVFEEMEKDPRVLDTYGTIPRFGTDGERRNWLNEHGASFMTAFISPDIRQFDCSPLFTMIN